MNLNMDPERLRKYKQIAVFGGVSLVALVLMSLFLKEPDKHKAVAIDEPEEINLANVTDGATEADLYRKDIAGRLASMEKTIKELNSREENSYGDLQERLTAIELQREQDEADANAAINAQQAEIQRLQAELEAARKQGLATSPPATQIHGTLPQGELFSPVQGGSGRSVGAVPQQGRAIQKVLLNLTNSADDKLPVFHTDSYIPAGAYVKARVVQGVAASVGIKAAADPRPISFRLTGQAIGPAKNGTPETYDLSGCVVTGAAQGDLSSERVYVRLLTMVCTKREGEVFEVEVNGHVASQGQAGIRGQVVSREGEFTQKAFLAGLFGGLGQAGQQLSQPTNTFTAGGFALADKATATEALGMGLGGGVAQAGNRLSDYLMDRAEQYQPVIVIPTGVEVELMFQKGVSPNVRS